VYSLYEYLFKMYTKLADYLSCITAAVSYVICRYVVLCISVVVIAYSIAEEFVMQCTVCVSMLLITLLNSFRFS
jgi:hypothetical protein